MACAWIGDRVLIVGHNSYFLFSVFTVLLLCNNCSYIRVYSPASAVDTSRKIPRASQFLLKSELIINMVNCLCVCIFYKAIQFKSGLQYTTDGPTRNAMFPFASALLWLSKLAAQRTEGANVVQGAVRSQSCRWVLNASRPLGNSLMGVTAYEFCSIDGVYRLVRPFSDKSSPGIQMFTSHSWGRGSFLCEMRLQYSPLYC